MQHVSPIPNFLAMGHDGLENVLASPCSGVSVFQLDRLLQMIFDVSLN